MGDVAHGLNNSPGVAVAFGLNPIPFVFKPAENFFRVCAGALPTMRVEAAGTPVLKACAGALPVAKAKSAGSPTMRVRAGGAPIVKLESEG